MPAPSVMDQSTRWVADPKPFRWIKSADDILASVGRCCLRVLDAGTAGQALARSSGSG